AAPWRTPGALPGALRHRGQRQIPLLSIHTVSLYKRRASGGVRGSTSHGEAMRSDKNTDNKNKKSAAAKNGHAIAPLDKDYRPSDKEPFMSERQREYFRKKLLDWKDDILKEAKETLQHLQDENQNHPDLADRASSETDRAIELRARDRQRKLIA